MRRALQTFNHDRMVAQCFVGETDVGDPMVREGFACDWVKYSAGHYSRRGGKACPEK